MSPLLLVTQGAHVGCMQIPSDGIVGEHEAVVDQLFVVVDGEGWVYGEDKVAYRIQKGTAAFWSKGENHASGSELGMTVMVIEAESLNPEEKMKELKELHSIEL